VAVEAEMPALKWTETIEDFTDDSATFPDSSPPPKV